jgi:pullulanase/glycogen debranching enzyme
MPEMSLRADPSGYFLAGTRAEDEYTSRAVIYEMHVRDYFKQLPRAMSEICSSLILVVRM